MKRIIDHLKENWIKYGFETLVITAGILLAFGLNNWNENRKVTLLKIETLKQVQRDLEADSVEFLATVETHYLFPAFRRGDKELSQPIRKGLYKTS